MSWIAPCLLIGATLAAQTGFHAEGSLVLVNASVFDRNNQFRPELRKEHFQVLDEGAEVALTSVGVEEVTLSTVIVLDISRSMANNMNATREALGRYLDKARQGDEYCLLAFSDHVPAECAFVDDPGEVREEAAAMIAGGGTALGDALLRAMAMVKRSRNQRRAILILSDGLDNSSAHNWKEVRRAAMETDAVLYAVSLPLWREQDAWEAIRLRELTEETGGRMLTARSARELPVVLEGLEVRLQYVLAFVPGTTVTRPGRHSVRVRLRGEATKHLRVYWRHSYSPLAH